MTFNLSTIFNGMQAISGLFMCIGIVYAARQVAISKQQATITDFQSYMPVVTMYLSAFRERPLEELRIYIKVDMEADLKKYGLDRNTPIKDFPNEMALKVQQVSHYLDHLGALVYHGYAKKEFVASFIGGEVEALWQSLKPHIYAQRNVTEYYGAGYYQIHFEWLATHCGKDKQLEIIKKIQSEI